MIRVLLVLALVLCVPFNAGNLHADMRIHIDDGRTIILPFSADEVKSVTFGDGQTLVLKSEQHETSIAPRQEPVAAAATSIKTDTTSGRILKVGKSHTLKTPSQAAAVARDGDTVIIDAETYRGDYAVWHQHDLTIRSQNGWVRLDGEHSGAEGKAIWVIKGNNVSIEGIEFFNAAVPDRNGAGIRAEGGKLTIRNCYFHDNETGLLSWNEERGAIYISNSVFADNYPRDASARASGRMHNIYIGRISHFTLEHSHVTGAITGHNIKSRARENIIRYNRIMDGRSGAASYQIDISDAGDSDIMGNLIQQSERADNYTVIAIGLENASAQRKGSRISFNTIINHKSEGIFARAGSGTQVDMHDNILVGTGLTSKGSGVNLRNNFAGTSPSAFVNFTKLDLRPKTFENFVADAGNASSARPDFEPSGIAKSSRRSDAKDRFVAGAFSPAS